MDHKLHLLPLVPLLSLSGVVGCTPDFDDIWLVKDLRILAIRADPPEVLADLSVAETPVVHLDALVVDPLAPENALCDWEIWACTPEKTTCAEAKLQLKVQEGRTRLGEIRADLVLDPQLLATTIANDSLKGFGGVPIIVELIVRRDELKARGIKRVVYGAFMPPEKRPNRNPTLARVLANDEEVPASWMVPASQKVTLLPEPGETSVEDYLVATYTGGSRELTEYLTYSFFTTAGEISSANTGGKPSPFATIKKVTDLSSDWTPASEPHQATLWVVVRDDRGGVGWTTISVEVQ